MSFGGFSSIPVSVHATADVVQATLQLIPSVGNVLVSRTEIVDTYGYSWTVTFIDSNWWLGDELFDVPLMTFATFDGSYNFEFATRANSSILTAADGRKNTLTGSNATVSVSRIVHAMSGFEQQAIELQSSGGAIAGSFSISFNGISTNPLNANSSEMDIEAALELIPGWLNFFICHFIPSFAHAAVNFNA